jgi:hypothetical protein
MPRALAVARRSEIRFQRRQLGQTVQVLWETRRRGLWYGMTDNYLRVVTRCHEDLALRLTAARLEAATAEGLQCAVYPSTWTSGRVVEDAIGGGRVPLVF